MIEAIENSAKKIAYIKKTFKVLWFIFLKNIIQKNKGIVSDKKVIYANWLRIVLIFYFSKNNQLIFKKQNLLFYHFVKNAKKNKTSPDNIIKNFCGLWIIAT